MRLQGQRLQLAIAVTGATAWILQGYDQALVNGLLTLPSFEATFEAINTDTPALAKKHSLLQGTTVALYEVGAAVGALSCFVLGERFGRRKTTLGAAVIVLIGVILQSTAYSLAQLIVARIVTGLGVGGFTATIPSYVGESVKAEWRGRLIMLEGSAAIFGIMFVSWMEFGFYYVPHDNPVSWRFPIAFQAVFALIVMISLMFLPESPRWLLNKGRFEEARVVLARLEGAPEDSAIVATRVEAIQHAIDLEQEGHSKNPFARTPNKHLNRTLLAIGVNILAQMSGINVITFYSNVIFQTTLGYSGTLSRIISACLQTWQFVAATTGIFLIDRFGRRRLLITGAILMTIANAGLTGLESDLTNSTVAGCSLIFYFLALGTFPICLFLIPFMYASEIAPLIIRSRVTAMAASSNWLFNFLVAEVSPVAFTNIQWRYYIVYVCTNSFSAIIFYLFAPETKGRALEDIDALFLEAKNPFDAVKVARTLPLSFTLEQSSIVRAEDGSNGDKEADIEA